MVGAEARAEYLRRVEASLTATDSLPLGYALMSSHTHWACITGREPPSRLMQSLHGGFAAWLNHQLHRLGPAFGGRFTDVVCPEERTGILLAYLHNNPVRAKVVDDPSDCDWTSHRAYLGLVAPPPWLNVKRGLSLCGSGTQPGG